jgi:hypothetical protein
MESTLITNVSALVESARRRDDIVLPAAEDKCVPEARRLHWLMAAANRQGYNLVRYSTSGSLLDLATATAPQLASQAIGIKQEPAPTRSRS